MEPPRSRSDSCPSPTTGSGTQAVDRAAQLVADRRASRRAADLRRPPGGQRARQVDDLADARGPRARRPARARRRRVATSPAACSGCTPPGTTRGRSWSGSPARPGAARRGDPRDRAPGGHPRRPGRPGRAGRLPLPARHPRLDRGRRTRPHLRARQGASSPGARSPLPSTLERAHPRDHHRPRRAAPRRRRTRRRGFAVTTDELEVGLTGIAVPVRGQRGEVVAALGISGPTARLADRRDEIGRLLSTQATQLTRVLRGQPRRNTAARRASHDQSRGSPAGPVRRDPGRQRPARPRADRGGPRRSAWSRRPCCSTR